MYLIRETEPKLPTIQLKYSCDDYLCLYFLDFGSLAITRRPLRVMRFERRPTSLIWKVFSSRETLSLSGDCRSCVNDSVSVELPRALSDLAFVIRGYL